ncbi:MAG: M48 family metallopeptidase [Planctomycetes bacterium]|nr:M48 family metallopeptidase [Planctomycetota bacterium]
MNFFEQQDRARRRTVWLVLLFLLAILCVAISFYGLALMAVAAKHPDPKATGAAVWWKPELFLQVFGGTCLIIFLGAGSQRIRLGGTGKSVAEALGGQPLQGSTVDPDEQKLRDVVSEMAIASGMPVPPIYLLEEEGINAFAAGNNPQTAILGFTRGAVARLNRDELQGVAGHEFSHVAHRDTLINMRLSCAVAGVMLIALIGRVMLQVAGRVATSPVVSRGKNDKGGAAAGFLAIGLALLVVGGIGAFFGRILQAAVSRQREFLADASAVQYSRNPAGIAAALRKIGSLPFAPIKATSASGLNHFFFSKSIHSWLSSHPPLAERIRRIEQTGFVDEISGARSQPSPIASAAQTATAQSASLVGGSAVTIARIHDAVAASAIPKESLDRARTLMGQIPAGLRDAAREPLDVQAVLLLLVTGSAARSKIRSLVQKQLGDPMAECWDRIAPLMANLPDEIRLVVLDLCVPTLTHLSKQQYLAFRAALTEAIRSDGQIDLFEWMLQAVLTRRIETRFGALPSRPGRYSLANCSKEIRIALGTLANAGGAAQAPQAFARGIAECDLEGMSFPNASECTLDALHLSLERLDEVAPHDREMLARALISTATSDGTFTTQELLLLRAFSARLDVPLPMLSP